MIFLDKHNILYMCTKWVWPARLTANHHETSCPSYRDTCLLVCFVLKHHSLLRQNVFLNTHAIFRTVLHVVVCLISLFHAHAQCCCSAYVTGYWGQWMAKLALCTEFGRWPTVIFIPGRGRPLINIQREQLCFLIEEGFRINDIAAIFSCSRRTIERR